MTQKTEPRNITFIGIGLMGSRMTARLLGAGYAVTIWNRSAEKCAPLVALGAVAAATPAEAVAKADVVITMLSAAPAVEEIYFGPGGIAEACPQDCILIDMSSLSPAFSRDYHARLAAMGRGHIDAPVSGGVNGAEAGTLAIMAGGTVEAIDRARPVFAPMGQMFHIGDGGAGQISKLVNQTIVHVTIGAVTEGLLLAASLGVDAGKVREAIGGGFCQSRILEVHGARMVERNFVAGGALQYVVKDLNGALTEAKGAHLALPLTQKVADIYRDMVSTGHGDYDHASLLLAYEAENAPHRVSPGVADKVPAKI